MLGSMATRDLALRLLPPEPEPAPETLLSLRAERNDLLLRCERQLEHGKRLYRRFLEVMQEKDQRIKTLENQVTMLEAVQHLYQAREREQAAYDQVTREGR